MQSVRSNEPIPGYTIRERIGAGGYGEVWRADAPGGLSKAIKFVYGYLDEDRASRELKALNRIKAVRHPFLLSLERIEVVEGQLIIVTELAESSLKDRFEECRKSELPGIPRDELLVYLRDAADALDFMSEQHSLQHLDVKPENLLLVGGRVKVADFGLVKELQDVTCSLMGGLTPLYAPPESFDGRPSRRSDQYSLAIVYQEMLTGVMPFPGTTAAQLAAQHLHSRPRLNCLPESDQPAIARALAKEPDERFPSCRAMAESLADAGKGVQVSGGSPQPSHANTDTITHCVSPTPAEDAPGPAITQEAARAPRRSSRAPAPVKVSLPKANADPQVVKLPPLALERERTRLSPTILLGVGGTAAVVFQRLRQILYDRFGGIEQLPALRMLLMDVDTRALMRTTQGDETVALHPRDTLPLPLRKPQDYRNHSGKLLKTISRRWLYNIPRSLLTEGLRPLGRLAFVDHVAEFEQRLAEALAAVRAPEAMAAASEKTGLEFDADRVRLFIVTSIAGGSGSGMLLDLAESIRRVCAEAEIEKHEIVAALTHSTCRTAAARDLAVVNTFALLKELRHMDRSAQEGASEESAARTFDDVYLYHLGDDLDERVFTEAADGLAQRLYLECASPAIAFFDQCRTADDESESDGATQLKSFGAVQIGNAPDADVPQAAEYLSRRVVDRWLGNEADTSAAGKLPDDAEVDRLTGELAVGLGLDGDALIREAQSIVEKQYSGKAEMLVSRAIAETLSPEQASDDAALFEGRGQILELLSQQFETHGPDASRAMSALAAHFTARAEKHAAAIDAWVVQLLDGSRARTRGSLRGAEWLARHVRDLQEQVQNLQQRIEAQRSQLDAAIAAVTPTRPKKQTGSAPTLDRLLVQFVQLRYYTLAAQGARGLLHALAQRIAATVAGVKALRQELMAAADEFEKVVLEDPTETGGWDQSPPDGVMKALRQRSAELIARIDRHIRDDFFAPQGGMLASAGSLRATLPNMLRSTARRAVRAAQSRGDAIERVLAGGPGESSPGLEEVLESAAPRLLACGGAKRLLTVLPYGCNPLPLQEALEKGFGETPTVVMDGAEGAMFCYEVERVAIEDVAASILDDRLDLAEVAERLHTRNDVDWKGWDE